jgi:protein O-GlcNAc transferase
MREVLKLSPRHMGTVANLGAILRAQRRPAEALEVYAEALAIAPDAATVLINCANLLNDLHRWPQALEMAERAVAAAPENALAHNALGNALAGAGRRDAAVESFRATLRLAPDYAAARLNMAKALLDLGRPDEALAAYDAAAAAQPGAAAVHAERGHVLAELRRWAEAAAAYDRAHELDPNLPLVAGWRLYARMKVCDWRDFDSLAGDFAAQIEADALPANPFLAIAAPLSARQQLRYAAAYCARTFPVSSRPPGAPPGPRIRLGYFSADFQEHATAYLMAEMLELHDRSAFEVTLFSFGPAAQTPMRRRLRAACEGFHDIAALGTHDACALARRLGLDIAVDLKGFTAQARPAIFAAGAAPVQVSFLGYPMTTGAPFMDYLIADRTLIGADERALYSEKIAWLPGCYQPNDRTRALAAATGGRAGHGLPEGAFVFASFNGAYKITPSVFRLWMDLLRAVPGAVLWLLQDEAAAMRNLIASAAQAGVDPGRLVFAPMRPLDEHLARIGHADLFLDTSPCCAHTTASDALWAGLPLLTLRGATFAGRVAASLLTALGLPELIAQDEAGYRETALALARDPARLADLRARLIQARAASPLFDTPAYVRDLEDLYRGMHARRLAGLAPAHLP